MPPVENDDAVVNPGDLRCDYGSFQNHGDLEDHPEAVETIMSYVDKDAILLKSARLSWADCVPFWPKSLVSKSGSGRKSSKPES